MYNVAYCFHRKDDYVQNDQGFLCTIIPLNWKSMTRIILNGQNFKINLSKNSYVVLKSIAL